MVFWYNADSMKRIIILAFILIFIAGCVPTSSVELLLGEENMKIIKESDYDLDQSFCVKSGDKTNKKMTLRQAAALALKGNCLAGKKITDDIDSLICDITSGTWTFSVEAKELGDVESCRVDIMTGKVTTNVKDLDRGYIAPGSQN